MKKVVEELLKEVRVISLYVCGVYKATVTETHAVPVWACHQQKSELGTPC